MASQGIRQRPQAQSAMASPITKGKRDEPQLNHRPKAKGWEQALRMVSLALYFFLSTVFLHGYQFLGLPLYFFNQDYYYAWQAFCKQQFGLVLTSMTQWWAPTPVRVSGDKSVRGQLRQSADGTMVCTFPERAVMIANHVIYTDWLYFWWMAYTARMHGHVFIILKESLKYIPILGPGMMFFSFVFLSRKWLTDKPRFQHRLQKLNSRHKGPLSGTYEYDPMWLLLFPEGTNISSNGREKSRQWAEKLGEKDLKHVLLPRSTGLAFCLQELKETVEWVYDCTVAYEGVPPGAYGQDVFSIQSMYFQGHPPKCVHLHWRRFAVSSMPIDDPKQFDSWLRDRWREKDELLEFYAQNGSFPADDGSDESVVVPNGTFKTPTALRADMPKASGHIDTEVATKNILEMLTMFLPLAALLLTLRVFRNTWRGICAVFGR